MYTALSRVTSYTSLIRVNTSALDKYERLHQNNIFETTDKMAISIKKYNFIFTVEGVITVKTCT